MLQTFSVLKKVRDGVSRLSTQTRVSKSKGMISNTQWQHICTHKKNVKHISCTVEIKVNRELSFEVVPLHQLKTHDQNVSISIVARIF